MLQAISQICARSSDAAGLFVGAHHGRADHEAAAMTDYAGVKAWRKANPGCRHREYLARKARHPEKLKIANAEAKKNYRLRNLEKVREMDRLAAARKRKADPEGQRARELRWRAKREAKLAVAAGGRPRPATCDLCGGSHGGIVFDHCHASGDFRGWLCDRCNKVLGLVYDDATLLQRMATYLQERRDGHVNRQAA